MATQRPGPLFSIGTFEALRRLRIQMQASAVLDVRETVGVLLRTDPDTSGLDFESSLVLHQEVPEHAQVEDPKTFYRICALHAVFRADLSWSRAITLGRRRFHDLLDRDERQCLREVGLMDDPPDDLTIDWWDQATELIRNRIDGQKQERGRAAERLTMSHEIERLRRLSIRSQPKWVSIDDNTAGYDVLSYEQVLGSEEGVPLLIEVKSSVASPLRFFVTRNEWKRALEYGSAYLFHVWDMTATPPRLHKRTAAQVAPHIPVDQHQGTWSTAVIPLAAQ